MDMQQMRLDGNAAAGLLAEVFAFEVTAAQAQCAGCGRIASVGALLVYGGPMGAILRCPGCDAAMIRVTQLRGEYRLDLRGTHILHVAAAPMPAP
jgi:hypothetical protein